MLLWLNVFGLCFNVLVAPESTVIRVPEDYEKIQEAINAAEPGDTIQVAAGTYYEHIVVNKSVILKGDNRASIIDGQESPPMIMNVTVGNVEIRGFTIQNGGNYGGIWVGTWTMPPPIKTHVNIINNVFINNGDCVYFSYCTYGTITNNIMEDSHYGVQLHDSDHNKIMGNKMDGMTRKAVNLYARSSNNEIINNTITNNKYGVLLESSNDNTVTLNRIASSTEYGIRLSYSTGTLVKCNTIMNNKYGAVIWNCSGNQFYHNNFIDNTDQAYHYDVAAPLYETNIWDTDLYPGDNNTGNYWSDYTGVDDGSGVGRLGEPRYANDSIGDTLVPHLGVDWYPLMYPWIPVPSPWPVAIFTWYPPEPIVNLEATFNASESYDRDGFIVSYKWDFNDETPVITESDPITTHTFTATGNYTVTLTVTDNDGLYNFTSHIITVLPYKLLIDVYTQKEPYSGRGPNQPSDAFAPQEEVILYAEVTYNYDLVQNKLVRFVVIDPEGGTLVDRSAFTNEEGIAEINFTLPTDPIFGTHTVLATVSVSEKNASDTLTFEVGWIIEIINLETVDEYGNPKINFTKGENTYFNIDLKNIAFTPKTAILTVSILDECNIPIGAAGLSIEVTPGTHEFNLILNLAIPEWSFVGSATAKACAFTNWPWMNGEPYCPERSTLFYIMSG